MTSPLNRNFMFAIVT